MKKLDRISLVALAVMCLSIVWTGTSRADEAKGAEAKVPAAKPAKAAAPTSRSSRDRATSSSSPSPERAREYRRGGRYNAPSDGTDRFSEARGGRQGRAHRGPLLPHRAALRSHQRPAIVRSAPVLE